MARARSRFSRLVDVVEVLVFLAALVFAVFLFANEPGAPYEPGSAAKPGAPASGAALFSANCARCHGSSGGGGIGPKLSGGAVVDDFPDAAGEVKVVTNGRGAMPSFHGVLTPAEIARVVEHTRTL